MIDIRVTKRENQKPRVVITYVNDEEDVRQIVRERTDAVNDIISQFLSGDIDEAELVDVLGANDNATKIVADAVNTRLRRVTNHISTDGIHVFIDNDTFGRAELDTTLEDHLVRLMRNPSDEHDWLAWSRFAERLYANTEDDVRSQMFRWLKSLGWLTVDSDGCLIGYRGCAVGTAGVPCSVHEGPAIVDGVPMNGHIPNKVGSIVEMPRKSVEHDAALGCASGLHVGTLDYAISWAPEDGYVIKVSVAPEDVVSVPFECDSQKMRVCRFTVVEATPRRQFLPDDWRDELTHHNDDEYDDDYDDEDDDWDEDDPF